MKILTSDPVKTAQRVRQLVCAYPLECAQALASQPEAIPMVGAALAEIASDVEASSVYAEAICRNRELVSASHAFYAASRAKRKTLPDAWPEMLKALAIGKQIESILMGPEFATEQPAS